MLEGGRIMYVNQGNTVNQLIFQSKMKYYSGLIEKKNLIKRSCLVLWTSCCI